MGSTVTRPDLDQLRFTSSRTGNWVLEDYLEQAEFGNRTLANLLGDIFNGDGTLKLTGLGTITIENGGTNATTATQALTNLGGTTVGKAVFTAADAAAARTAMEALGTADTINLAVNSSNAVITDDPTNAATHYPTFGSGTSGNRAMKTSSTTLTFKPSVGLMGIGTAHSGSTFAGFDIGTTAGLYQNSGNGAVSVTQNSYYNGTNWIAKTTAAGALYQAGATAGTHNWYSAASVTAGASQSWTTTLALDASGNLTATANVTAYSDERLKKNWRDLPENFLERLAGVKVGVYERVDVAETQVGVSAQSLAKVMPEAVRTDEDSGYLSVAYGNAALAACVALANRVVELEARLNALEAK